MLSIGAVEVQHIIDQKEKKNTIFDINEYYIMIKI